MTDFKTDAAERGWTTFWAVVALVAIICLVFGGRNRTERMEALRADLLAPRPETAAEASAADAAERLPDIAVKPGLWTREIARAGAGARLDLLLRDDRTFVATATGRIGEAEKFTVSAEGDWRVRGSALVFSVASGAKGLFPASGRVAVRRATGDELVLAEADGEAVLKHQDLLTGEAAARALEEEARSAARAAFAALPPKAVPPGRWVEWLFEQELFLKSVAGIVLMALVFTGWSAVRRGTRR